MKESLKPKTSAACTQMVFICRDSSPILAVGNLFLAIYVHRGY